jgi:hypothetical protein
MFTTRLGISEDFETQGMNLPGHRARGAKVLVSSLKGL